MREEAQRTSGESAYKKAAMEHTKKHAKMSAENYQMLIQVRLCVSNVVAE